MLRERFGTSVGRLWRPPYGSRAKWQRQVARDAGVGIRTWDIDTGDWRGRSAERMLRRIKPRLRDGAVLLMHDGIAGEAERYSASETVRLVLMLAAVADGFDRMPGG